MDFLFIYEGIDDDISQLCISLFVEEGLVNDSKDYK